MIYWSRPFEVDVEQWTDIDDPPMGIHDVWRTGEGTVYGYLPTPTGDKMAWLNCYVVLYPSGDLNAFDEDELNLRFQPTEIP